MSLETNRTLVRRWVDEYLSGGSVESLRALARPDMINHTPRQYPNLAGMQDVIDMTRAAFPDLRFEIVDMIAEEDKVAVRVTITGTHKNFILRDIPPSGTPVRFTGIIIFRIEDDLIAEAWAEFDEMELYHQLGAILVPGQTPNG